MLFKLLNTHNHNQNNNNNNHLLIKFKLHTINNASSILVIHKQEKYSLFHYSQKLLSIFEGIHYSIFITVVTLITLFADDFRVIFFTANEDFSFTILNLICMIIFFIEIIVLSFVKVNNYLIVGKLFSRFLFLA
jgi:hypothetical protein